MKPFRAVYDRTGREEGREVVLVIAILPVYMKSSAIAVFVDAEGAMGEAEVHRFIDCQVEWPERRV